MALFSCPKCSWRVKITDKDLGKKAKCLQCAHEYVIPSALPKDVLVATEKPAPASALTASGAQPSASLTWVALVAAVVMLAAIVVGVLYLMRGGGGPQKAFVTGTVKYEGKPLASGSVSLLGENGFA